LALDGSPSELQAGETVVIEPGTRHAFSTTTGCVLEEISTSHYQDDSYYTDPMIMENLERKTILKYWFD
jgi:D-lyxose ketol-isomerase